MPRVALDSGEAGIRGSQVQRPNLAHRSLKVTDAALDSVTDMRKINGAHDDGEPQPVHDTDIPRAARSAETASTNIPNDCHSSDTDHALDLATATTASRPPTSLAAKN